MRLRTNFMPGVLSRVSPAKKKHVHVDTYIYIDRVKAGGSPEANCILFVWIWKMLILHCVLQCFMLFSESVRSAKVSMSARINLTFVRAEK